jgi:hypothetical protein
MGAAGVAMLGNAGVAAATATQATPAPVPLPNASTLYLFVQTFGAGALEPVPDQLGRFLLTLTEAHASTIAFADHPSRETSTLPTQQLPDVLAFDAANPPNASLVTRTGDGEEIVVVIELLDPTYDAATATVTYKVTELADYSLVSDDFAARAQSIAALPATFGPTSLFIDSADSCVGFLGVCESNSNCCSTAPYCTQVSCAPNDPNIYIVNMGLCMN